MNQMPQPSGAKRPSKDDMEKWNKAIGMPEEIELGPEASLGMQNVISEIRKHYIMTPGDEYGAHLEMLGRAKGMAHSADATAEEIESLDEDFMRSIEDEIAAVEKATVSLWGSLLKRSPILLNKSDAAFRQMRLQIKKEFPEFTPEVIDVIISKTAPYELR